MAYSEEYQNRLNLLKKTIRFEHVNRVAHFSNFFTWKILDSDLKPKLSQALADYGMLDQIQCEFQERYDFDAHYDLLARNLLKPSEVMGGRHHHIDDEAESINFFDQPVMEGNEYRDFVDKPWDEMWKMFLRKYPDLDAETFAKAIIQNVGNEKYNPYMQNKFIEKYNCVYAYGPVVYQVPYERFHKYLRGIKNATLDLRRYKEDTKYCFDKIQSEQLMPAMKKGLEGDTSRYMSDTMTAFLAHAFLNMKTWDEIYWPHQKEFFDAVLASKKDCLVYCEDSMLRFADYFKDYPKGFLALCPEKDDVKELRKAMPNICIVGGVSHETLGRGTKQQVVYEMKQTIDAMGDGYMAATDKMMSFRPDCTRENLLALCEFLHEFRW